VETKVTNFRLTEEDLETLDNLQEYRGLPTRTHALRYALKLASNALTDELEDIYQTCLEAPPEEISRAYQTVFGEPMKSDLPVRDAVSRLVERNGHRPTYNLIFEGVKMTILLYPLVDGLTPAMVFSFDPIDLNKLPGTSVNGGPLIPFRAPPPVKITVPAGSTLEGTPRRLVWTDRGEVIRSDATKVYTFALSKHKGFQIVNS
jgi:hypothetical protein